MRAIRLQTIMSRRIVSVPPGTLIPAALDLMAAQNVSCVLVIGQDGVVGILTERDLAKRFFSLEPSQVITVDQVMTPAPITVPDDMDHFEAFKVMKAHRFRHLLVTSDGALAGIVTETDFVRHLGFDFYVRPKDVLSVMAPATGIDISRALTEAIQRFAAPGTYCVVAEQDGQAVGIITERDLVRLLRQGAGRPGGTATVGQVMSAPLHTIGLDTSLMEASEMLQRLGIRHLVVVDQGGHAKGIVSEHEIVRGLESEYVVHLERIITEKTEVIDELNQAHAALIRQTETLQHTMAELAMSHEELREFARVASHDLQEPSRVVVSFIQLLLKRHGDQLGPEARELAEFAVDGATRMRALVQDIAAYALATSTMTSSGPVEVARVVAVALDEKAAEIAGCGAAVTVGDLPTIHQPWQHLLEIFRNLIANALRFRNPERPLTIAVTASPANGGWRFSVADNGIGIEPEYHGDIFRLFTRLHPPSPQPGKGAGTGAGLAICKRIVTAMGGKIWVEATVGVGSCFHFTIPAG